jgi:SAM-dependent methyltransferase
VHPVILGFAEKHLDLFSGRVLDVGSYNVNGALREVLPVTLGVDMRKGPGVDEVCNAVDLIGRYGPESFDCVVSAEALEHIKQWDVALHNMWSVLKPNGVFLLTMASPRKGRHAYPDDYWRFPMDRFLGLFGENPILDTFDHKPSQGVITRKMHPLDLTIIPTPVP